MDLSAIRAPVNHELAAVDELILRRLHSEVALINQIGHYIVSSGGKRLRPLVVVLAARACGYTGERHIDLAAIIEFIHTATLLHDDVVDGSTLRRNRDTVNSLWGNEASVLVGDFLYSRAFEMMVDVGLMRVMEVLAHATNRISEGEVLQLLNTHDPDTSEARYLEVIQRKTATLFEAGDRDHHARHRRNRRFRNARCHRARIAGAEDRHDIEDVNHAGDRAEQSQQRTEGDQHFDHRHRLIQLYARLGDQAAPDIARVSRLLVGALLPGSDPCLALVRERPIEIQKAFDDESPQCHGEQQNCFEDFAAGIEESE